MAGMENLTCRGCGDKGHFERDCPNAGIDTSGRPPWCGFCDERTRLVDGGDVMSRCLQCHPARHQTLKQHRRCPHCHMIVYQWDNGECGSHSSPAAKDRRPEREEIDAIVAAQSGGGE